jgi:hypothetical protein
MSFRIPDESSSDASEPTLPNHETPSPTMSAPSPTVLPSTSGSRRIPWPKWSGEIEDYAFYHQRLACRIEEATSELSNKMICYQMVETLPEKKQKLVADWFGSGGENGDWAWTEFLEHFITQFENKQAKEEAAEDLSRIRQGATQWFKDFLSDFEYKLTIAGGRKWPDSMRVALVRSGINLTLKTALSTKVLAVNNYTEWMRIVKVVAGQIENLPSYRPKGSPPSQAKTWHLRQPGTVGYSAAPPNIGGTSSPSPKVDSQGDTIMGGTAINAIVAAVVSAMNDKKGKGKGGNDSRPRAPWRTPEAFRRLMDKGVCSRCEKPGHMGRNCPEFRAAVNPKSTQVATADTTVATAKEDENKETDSENE